jgi:hypothetical protein
MFLNSFLFKVFVFIFSPSGTYPLVTISFSDLLWSESSGPRGAAAFLCRVWEASSPPSTSDSSSGGHRVILTPEDGISRGLLQILFKFHEGHMRQVEWHFSILI